MVLLDLVPACQLNCEYCYMRPLFGRVPKTVDVKAVVETAGSVLEDGDEVVFHGFEPLMTPIQTRSAIVRRLQRPGLRFSIQTNALALEGEELQWAAEHLHSVGVSWDGDWPLGKLRYKSRKISDRVWENILAAVESMSVGVISVITDLTLANQDLYFRSVEKMARAGIHSLRANPVHRPMEITDLDELARFYKRLAQVCVDTGFLRVTPLSSLQQQVGGERPKDCSWQGCDPLGTVIPILLGDGSLTNCGKFRGTHWQGRAHSRIELLRQLPMSRGGCRGCPWFDVCRGYCPATSEREDGYGRTRLCPVWIELREYLGANPFRSAGPAGDGGSEAGSPQTRAGAAA